MSPSLVPCATRDARSCSSGEGSRPSSSSDGAVAEDADELVVGASEVELARLGVRASASWVPITSG